MPDGSCSRNYRASRDQNPTSLVGDESPAAGRDTPPGRHGPRGLVDHRCPVLCGAVAVTGPMGKSEFRAWASGPPGRCQPRGGVIAGHQPSKSPSVTGSADPQRMAQRGLRAIRIAEALFLLLSPRLWSAVGNVAICVLTPSSRHQVGHSPRDALRQRRVRSPRGLKLDGVARNTGNPLAVHTTKMIRGRKESNVQTRDPQECGCFGDAHPPCSEWIVLVHGVLPVPKRREVRLGLGRSRHAFVDV